MPAPEMQYYLPDGETFTRAHRAQLSRSHKKVQQLLGVAPSLVPVPATPFNSLTSLARPQIHRRTQSCAPPAPTKSHGRERGRLANLFRSDAASSTTALPLTGRRLSDESDMSARDYYDSIPRGGRTSSETSSSSSTEFESSDYETELESPPLPHNLLSVPKHGHGRPTFPSFSSASSSSSCASNLSDDVIDITQDDQCKVVDADDTSPLFKANVPLLTPAEKEEKDYEDMISEALSANLRPCDKLAHCEKKQKITRLARHFGVHPPLELVFPPTPTSQSHADPKRYTFNLPPPQAPELTCGIRIEPADADVYFDGDANDVEQTEVTEVMDLQNGKKCQGKTVHVFWDCVQDEKGREKVMDVLRQL